MYALKDELGRYFSGLLSDPWRRNRDDARWYVEIVAAQRMAAKLGEAGHATTLVMDS